ncbi:MAG: flagellar hook-length control protein FliK [Proteobacteria bacterium]|nr:flagellar hook-length control protein FliK [Pseudomonadota bacterium]
MPGEANAVVANGTSAPSATASSAAPSAPARPAPVLLPLLDQVLPSLSQAASGNGSGRFTIQLRPPELGRIQVDLKIAADGHVTATIVADRQDTLSLLQRDSHQLEQSLSDAGLSTNNGDLQFSLSGDSQGTDFDEPNASSYNAGIAATATVEDTAAPAVARQIGGLSLVDLHV